MSNDTGFGELIVLAPTIWAILFIFSFVIWLLIGPRGRTGAA